MERYRGNPRVQAHGPGFSKILLGDDQVDQWERYLDVMVDSVFLNSGRSCINCSGIWASRHTREIADALAQRLAAVRPLPPDHPDASLAAFTVPGAAEAISRAIDAESANAGRHRRDGEVSPRRAALVKQGRADYLLPTVLHCGQSRRRRGQAGIHVSVRDGRPMSAGQMLEAIGPTLVCSAITCNDAFRRQLLDAVHIDRLNLGPVPTTQLNWLQPHEGNIVEFLLQGPRLSNGAPAVTNAQVTSHKSQVTK